MAQSGKGNGGNDWNSLMQSREAQVVLYGIVVVFCAYHAIDAVRELMSPERSAALVEAMGQTAYYVVTILRAVVCVGTGAAFARMALRAFREK